MKRGKTVGFARCTVLFAMTGCMVIFGCAPRTQRSGGNESVADKSPKPALSMPEQGPGIAPNRCRIIAHVIAIDSALFRKEPAGPCATYPCMATVEVDSVLGYGSAFAFPLSKRQRVDVRFAYTMGPTKELFPSMADSYPGLSIRSSFEAEVLSAGEGENGKSSYVVNGYKLKE